MERLTRPNVSVDPKSDAFLNVTVTIETIRCKLLELILNGPTLNGVPKDVLRRLLRQLYDALKAYEDTGLTPEQILALKAELVDERYRHDRLQDFCVAQSDQLDEARKNARITGQLGVDVLAENPEEAK